MIDLNTIHKMWEKDSVIDKVELDTTSIETSKLHAKYLSLFDTARMLLKKRELKLTQLKKNKWRYYTGKMTQDEMDAYGWPYDPFNGCSKPLKSEVNYFIDSDDDVQDLQMKVEYSKIVMESLEEILGNIRWRHQVIKNIIEYRKFTSGM